MIRTVEAQMIISAHRKTVVGKIRNEHLQQSNIQEMRKWIKEQRKCWKKHASRMGNGNLGKTVQINNAIGKRNRENHQNIEKNVGYLLHSKKQKTTCRKKKEE